jgi:hypothetical protein
MINTLKIGEKTMSIESALPKIKKILRLDALVIIDNQGRIIAQQHDLDMDHDKFITQTKKIYQFLDKISNNGKRLTPYNDQLSFITFGEGQFFKTRVKIAVRSLGSEAFILGIHLSGYDETEMKMRIESVYGQLLSII